MDSFKAKAAWFARIMLGSKVRFQKEWGTDRASSTYKAQVNEEFGTKTNWFPLYDIYISFTKSSSIL